MSENAVITEVHEGVAKITLNEPESLNALSNSIVRGLREALIRVEDDESVRVVILTGKGKGFCAGGHIKEFPREANALAIRDWMRMATALALQVYHLEKPVIAAVNGYAVGAGFSLALACDLIIASEEAVFGMVFNKIGAVPDMGAHYYLPRLVGMQNAKYIMFTAEQITAEEAKKLGIAFAVVPAEELEAEAQKLAAKLAKGATAAIRMSKSILQRTYGMSLEDVLHEEAMAQGIAFTTHDHKEGVSAFLEKRTPNFVGR